MHEQRSLVRESRTGVRLDRVISVASMDCACACGSSPMAAVSAQRCSPLKVDVRASAVRNTSAPWASITRSKSLAPCRPLASFARRGICSAIVMASSGRSTFSKDQTQGSSSPRSSSQILSNTSSFPCGSVKKSPSTRDTATPRWHDRRSEIAATRCAGRTLPCLAIPALGWLRLDPAAVRCRPRRRSRYRSEGKRP
jgi:hypothetical protein